MGAMGTMGTLGYMSLVNELGRARKDVSAAKLSLIKAQNDEEKEVWKVAVMDVSETVKELKDRRKEFN